MERRAAKRREMWSIESDCISFVDRLVLIELILMIRSGNENPEALMGVDNGRITVWSSQKCCYNAYIIVIYNNFVS